MNYKKIALGALAYFISSFVIQGLLGFALAGDYFLSIPILRIPPTAYLALPQAILAGIAFAILYPITNFNGTPVLRGLKFGLLIVSYTMCLTMFSMSLCGSDFYIKNLIG